MQRFRQTVKKIIAYDLDLIEHRCDAIVCYWDQYAGRGAGTQGELTFAHRKGIPVYLICGDAGGADQRLAAGLRDGSVCLIR